MTNHCAKLGLKECSESDASDWMLESRDVVDGVQEFKNSGLF